MVCFEDKDLEYLEAACLLHNIGLYAGKKGYHKQSYQVIIVSNPSRSSILDFSFASVLAVLDCYRTVTQ